MRYELQRVNVGVHGVAVYPNLPLYGEVGCARFYRAHHEPGAHPTTII